MLKNNLAVHIIFTARFLVDLIFLPARTGKNIKSTKNSAVRDHMLVCNNIASFEDFSVLAHGTNDFRIKMQESLLIHRDGPQLKKPI